MLTEQHLREIEARLAAATPGPYREGKAFAAIVSDHPVPEIGGSDDVQYYGGHLIGESIASNNRPFLAHAWQDVTDLLAEVRRMRELKGVR